MEGRKEGNGLFNTQHIFLISVFKEGRKEGNGLFNDIHTQHIFN